MTATGSIEAVITNAHIFIISIGNQRGRIHSGHRVKLCGKGITKRVNGRDRVTMRPTKRLAYY
jgi:hypothetical protein